MPRKMLFALLRRLTRVRTSARRYWAGFRCLILFIEGNRGGEGERRGREKGIDA